MSEEQKTPYEGQQKRDIEPANVPSPDNKSGEGAKILGFNLAFFALYTIGGNIAGDEGLLAAVFFAGFHFVVCVIAAIASRKWVWLLAGLIILVIGLGTCFAGV
ncbi:hypothetical protein SAMN06265348_102447 [Pedobacter westerhofensis]|uniref:Uncharacterized protein n=2 Tax=Pedobacter westerhofensis TaxID=425512 RepID=A0A521BNJ5_9SPHI|nr:hypothetical protein SAMN06265348_102447 [Pedobacter westerhofensis]